MRSLLLPLLALGAILSTPTPARADSLGCALLAGFGANPVRGEPDVTRWAAVDVEGCGKISAERSIRWVLDDATEIEGAPLDLDPHSPAECLLSVEVPALTTLFDQGWELQLLREGVVEDSISSAELGVDPDNGLSWFSDGSWHPYLPSIPACMP